MALLADEAATLLSRQNYRCPNNQYYSHGRCYSAWSWYGRWIFAAVVVVVVIAVFFLWACINSRRRRRRGTQPMYGTGWMAGGQGHNNNNPQYYNNNQGGYVPPPAYGPPQGQAYPMNNQPTGNTFQTSDGYYGQREGVQAPKNVYGGQTNGTTDYAPPAGPPPNK